MNKAIAHELHDGDVLIQIFPAISKANEIEKFNNVAETLNLIKKEINKLCDGYIWHNDQLQIQAGVYGDTSIQFTGILNYAENVEDEWFAVHVLLQLTLKFDGLIIRVSDSDGEFLLIEAAEVLPSWVSPETCESRVFLYKGHVHILPQSFKPNDDSEEPFEISEEVLSFIRTRPVESLVHPSIEQPIIDRIGSYPAKLSSLLHNAVVYVPVAVAAILHHKPNCVTAAVRAFCERTPSDLQACRAMKYFPPEQRVLANVTFTKCAYAMLVSSKYSPDRRTGWNLPPPTHESYKAHLLGIKLASGFEIIVTQDKKENNSQSMDDISSDPNWLKMKTKLESIGYFRGLIEHSKEYNELLNKAQEFHRLHCHSPTKINGGSGISEVLNTIEIDIEMLKREEAHFNVGDNDDSWMNISKEEFDEMLAARFGVGQDLIDAPNKPDSISKHLNSFIHQVSGVDGVDFPKQNDCESPPIKPSRGVKTKKKKSVQFSSDTKMHSVSSNDAIAQENRVNFQPDGFMQALQNILDLNIPDDNYWDSEGSGMSSYEDEDEIDLGQSTSTNKNKMASYMDEMDKQLSSTTIGRSFVTKPAPTNEATENFEDVENFEPVDIDMNAFKNIIMSYKTQMGDAGPAENILGPMGVHLQDIDADVD